MNLRYHALAREEVIQITEHYAGIRAVLGAEFLAELNSATDAILAHPLTSEQIKPGIRRYLMERFPYGIYYRLPDDDTVRIILVRHHSRWPGYGVRRK
jgi:plasmid stabilization system protein ParE